MTPRIGSACSGYGGLDLGLMAVVGGSVAWHVEYDENPAKVLDARFPGVPNHGDVKHTDWAALEPVDVFTAGYPCQPFSAAGKRLGAADERHLWPHVAHAIGVLRPGLVVLENVANHLVLGFDVVLADLAALGYDATWGVVRASDAGAPHGRARLFIVAQDANRAARGERWLAAPGQAPGGWAWANAGGRGRASASDAAGAARRGAESDLLAAADGRAAEPRERAGAATWGPYAPAIRRWERITGNPAPRPTEPGRTGDRLSVRFVEWMMGLPAGWVTDILEKNPALRCLGNGVVPQQGALALSVLLHKAGQVAA